MMDLAILELINSKCVTNCMVAVEIMKATNQFMHYDIFRRMCKSNDLIYFECALILYENKRIAGGQIKAYQNFFHHIACKYAITTEMYYICKKYDLI